MRKIIYIDLDNTLADYVGMAVNVVVEVFHYWNFK
jgi:hypothetical protein